MESHLVPRGQEAHHILNLKERDPGPGMSLKVTMTTPVTVPTSQTLPVQEAC